MNCLRLFIALSLTACVAQAQSPEPADSRPAGAAAAAARPFQALFRPPAEDTFRSVVAAASAPPIARAGLPDPEKHPEAFARRAKERGVEWIDGYPYEKETISLPESTVAALKELFSSGKAFSPGDLGEGCSTFHPEIRLEWTSGDTNAAAAIGLGCQEILAGVGSETFRRYIPPASYGPLDRLLAPLLPED